MLDKLAVSENPASEAQKGNRNAVSEKNDSADLPVGLSPQLERAKSNGLSERNQRTLDKIAKLSPDYLPRIAAKEITINRAAVELGIVKGRAGRNRQSPSRPGVGGVCEPERGQTEEG